MDHLTGLDGWIHVAIADDLYIFPATNTENSHGLLKLQNR